MIIRWSLVVQMALALLAVADLRADPPLATCGTATSGATYDGDAGMTHASSACLPPSGTFNLSVFLDNLDRNPRDVDVSSLGVAGSWTLSHRVEAFAGFTLLQGVKARFPGYGPAGPAGFPFAGDSALSNPGWNSGPGDGWAGVKYALVSSRTRAFALRLKGLIPTADAAKGRGISLPAVSGDLVASRIANGGQWHTAVGWLGWLGNARGPGGASVAPSDLFRASLGYERTTYLTRPGLELVYERPGGQPRSPSSLDATLALSRTIRRGGNEIVLRPAVSKNLLFDEKAGRVNWLGSSGAQMSITLRRDPTPSTSPSTPPSPAVHQCRPDGTEVLPYAVAWGDAATFKVDNATKLSWRIDSPRAVPPSFDPDPNDATKGILDTCALVDVPRQPVEVLVRANADWPTCSVLVQPFQSGGLAQVWFASPDVTSLGRHLQRDATVRRQVGEAAWARIAGNAGGPGLLIHGHSGLSECTTCQVACARAQWVALEIALELASPSRTASEILLRMTLKATTDPPTCRARRVDVVEAAPERPVDKTCPLPQVP